MGYIGSQEATIAIGVVAWFMGFTIFLWYFKRIGMDFVTAFFGGCCAGILMAYIWLLVLLVPYVMHIIFGLVILALISYFAYYRN